MRNVIWGVILVTIGLLMLLDNLGVASFEDVISDYWPLILIVWGLSILVRKRERHAEGHITVAQQIDSDLIHQSNVFGDLFATINSQNFKGGSVSTVFGGCDLDLSKASIAEGEHVLRIHSIFGHSSVTLAKDAAVSVSASSLFGNLTVLGQQRDGFSNDIHATTSHFSSSPNRLKISISKVFGDVRVVYPPDAG